MKALLPDQFRDRYQPVSLEYQAKHAVSGGRYIGYRINVVNSRMIINGLIEYEKGGYGDVHLNTFEAWELRYNEAKVKDYLVRLG